MIFYLACLGSFALGIILGGLIAPRPAPPPPVDLNETMSYQREYRQD